MAIIVSYYGIHWDDHKQAYLMQGRGGTNAIGLRTPPPFEVRLESRARHCNHQIPLAAPIPNDFHWDYFSQLLDDPLVRAMLPLPKMHGGIYYLNANAETETLLYLLTNLSRLSSPIYGVVIPVFTLNRETILNELKTTNVQPLIVTEMEARNSELLSVVGKAAVYQPRSAIFVGHRDVVVPATVKRIETTLPTRVNLQDFMALPWESIGATVVRKFMRNQWSIRRPHNHVDEVA